jgi:hypothetical protein
LLVVVLRDRAQRPTAKPQRGKGGGSMSGELSALDMAIAEIEAEGLNWETSKKGKWPDGTWQRHGLIWHPRYMAREGIAHSRDSNADALHRALAEYRRLNGGRR